MVAVLSLGQLGGTGFTRAINAPEVAVLGMAPATCKMIEIDEEFVTRLMFLFCSLSLAAFDQDRSPESRAVDPSADGPTDAGTTSCRGSEFGSMEPV